jgi:hypothetical protein
VCRGGIYSLRHIEKDTATFRLNFQITFLPSATPDSRRVVLLPNILLDKNVKQQSFVSSFKWVYFHSSQSTRVPNHLKKSSLFISPKQSRYLYSHLLRLEKKEGANGKQIRLVLSETGRVGTHDSSRCSFPYRFSFITKYTRQSSLYGDI